MLSEVVCTQRRGRGAVAQCTDLDVATSFSRDGKQEGPGLGGGGGFEVAMAGCWVTQATSVSSDHPEPSARVLLRTPQSLLVAAGDGLPKAGGRGKHHPDTTPGDIWRMLRAAALHSSAISVRTDIEHPLRLGCHIEGSFSKGE